MSELERLMQSLILEFEGLLVKGVTDSAFDLLNNGEPRLALETLCDYINEADLTVDARQLDIIHRLGRAWECDPSRWSDLRLSP
jgi:hypothetical protein